MHRDEAHSHSVKNPSPECRFSVDLDDGSLTGARNQTVDIDDLLYFLIHFEAGC